MPMMLSEAGKDFIKKRESCVLKPHWDAIGKVWDIGWGHVFKPNEPHEPITQEEADALFDTDMLYYIDQVNDMLVIDVTQSQFDALVSFAYNVGTTGLRNSTVLTYVNAEMHADACVEALTWRKAKGANVEGLLNRRAHEVLVYARGDYT